MYPLKTTAFLYVTPTQLLVACFKKKQLKTLIKQNMPNDYYGIKAILPGQWYGPAAKVLALQADDLSSFSESCSGNDS